MNKNIFLSVSLTLMFLTACTQNFVKIKGKISNQNSNEFIIKNNNGYTKNFVVSENGEFSDTLKIPSSGIYSFSDGRESSSIYLKNGYDLSLSIDTKEFDETIKYNGKGAENNNFIAQKYLINEKEFGDFTYYKLNEKEFMNKIDSVNSVYNSMLDKLSDKEFIDYQKKEIKYNYYISIMNYDTFHSYLTKNNEYKVSDNFNEPLKNIDYNNSNDYDIFFTYKSLVNNHYLSGIRDTTKTDSILISINKIEQENIKEGVIADLNDSYFNIRNTNLSFLYNSIQKNCTDQKYLKDFNEKYESLKKLLKGNPSAKFSFEDVNGKTVNLDDFKGKYVYIDVWATWCSPCVREIPFLKKLEEDYHSKDIVFVSISVDNKRDFEKWKKMVKDRELKGYQLYADKSWKSDFIKAYQINAIPTFILIDDKGNIVSASANRPSNPKIRTQFDELLK